MTLGRVTGGEILRPTRDGRLVERMRCSTCGERLERVALTHWHTAGSLVPKEPLVLIESAS